MTRKQAEVTPPDVRALLVHCARYNRLTPIVTMGLWGLADILTRDGHPTRILHTGVENEVHGGFEVSRYLTGNVVLVGISLHWFPASAEALDLAAEIKAHDPRVFVVLGGFSASYFNREILALSPHVDAVMRGDAEEPIRVLMNHLAPDRDDRRRRDGVSASDRSDEGPSRLAGGTDSNRPRLDLHDVPNLIWRSGEEIIENPFTYVAGPENLRDVSLGNYRAYLLNYDHARESQSFAGSSAIVADFDADFSLNPMFYLLTGKGCYVNCTMCGGGRDAQALINNRRHCMFVDPDTVVRTIREAMDHGYRSFYVCFDPVPPHPRYTDWLRRIREEKLDINLCFGFWGLPPTGALDELTRTSRNVLVDVSPETISEESRRRNKGFHYSNQELHRCLDELHARGIYTHVYFSYFLPHQTETELHDTRVAYWEINARYPHYIESTIIKISTDPASPLQRHPEEYGARLTVTDFASHVDLCRQDPDANILIHEIETLPAGVQDIYERRFRFDTGFKRLFRYYTKLFVRAFPSVPAFVEFLDRFYERNDLLDGHDGIRRFRNHTEILGELRSFTRAFVADGGSVEPYVVDIVEYIAAMVATRESGLDAVRGPDAGHTGRGDAGITARVPRLAGDTRVVSLEFDVFSARQHLRTRKAFPPLERSPVDLLISGRDGVSEILRVNDSMYRLCEACAGNESLTTDEILENVASCYSDDREEKRLIKADLLETLRELAGSGRLVLA